jgi:hypothetical protein
MSLHLDCSTLDGWNIDNSESPLFNVSTDVTKIYVDDGPFTADNDALSLYATKPVAVSGDFDIVCNITMPDTEAFKDYVDLNFDIFIDFDSPIYNSDASKSAGYICFRYSVYKVGEVYSPRTIYLQNLQPASEGVNIAALLPWTGNLRLTRVDGVITAYVDSTVLWSSTHDNSTPNIIDINPDWGTLAKSNYPVTCPNMSINDINITGSTVPNDSTPVSATGGFVTFYMPL